jgi:hypothetical protein
LNMMCRTMLKDVCARNELNFEEECRLTGISDGISVVSEELVVEKTKKMSTPAASTAVKTRNGKIPLPFTGVANDACCSGLKHNEGLMTQCRVLRKGGEDFCKTCKNQADKNGSNVPIYGCIQDRMKGDMFEYVAPNGERPTAYSSVMVKFNLTEEMVQEEAAKMNIVIDKRHFEKVEDTSSARRGRPKASKDDETSSKETVSRRGRPKKDNKVVELVDGDLFAYMVAQQDTPVVAAAAAAVEVVAEEAKVVVDDKADKKAEKEAKKAEKEAKKAEKEAKKAAKEAKKAVEEQALKKAEEVEEEVVEEKKVVVAEKKVVVEEKKVVVEEKKVEEEVKDTVKRFVFEGKTYLRSPQSGIIYDESTSEELGEWNAKTNSIDFYEVEEEEEEEEYEEE